MNWLDIGILIIIGLFAIVGLLRGFMGEIFSLLTWVVSFFVAWFFSGDFTGWFVGHVKDANLRAVLVFFAVFFVTFVAMTVVSHFAGTIWRQTAPKGADRALGAVIGGLKGASVIVIMVLLAGLTPFPAYQAWRQSALVGYFQDVAIHVARWLPADVARNLRYR
ncbi:MAG: CvpA family protein [Acidiferrobacter sp.]